MNEIENLEAEREKLINELFTISKAADRLAQEGELLRADNGRLRKELDSIEAWSSEPHVPDSERRTLELINRISRRALGKEV